MKTSVPFTILFYVVNKRSFGLFIKVKSEIVISQLVYLEAVLFVFRVVKRLELVDGKLMEFVEVVPPFPATAKLVGEIGICDIAGGLRSNVECTHSQYVYTVSGYCASCRRETFNNT